MKRKFIPFILLVSTIFFVSSCLGDDNEEIVFSDQVGITAFSLGTQKIIRDTVSKKGADSTYQTTLDCSKYIFYIDQTKHEIYNPDSLPVGIDCKKIICNVTSKGSSVTLVKNIDSDTLQAFETIDSMDFSKPRTLRMVSMSGRASCDYTVKVNIHKQKPNVFEWKIATGCTDMGLLTGMRALAMGGKVYVVGRDDSQLRIYAAEEQHVVSWTEITPNVELGADSYKDMTVMGGKLYAHAEDGVYCSTDAYTWTRVGTPAISRLLGGSNKRLYALSTDNKIVASADGATWTAEKMDTPRRLAAHRQREHDGPTPTDQPRHRPRGDGGHGRQDEQGVVEGGRDRRRQRAAGMDLHGCGGRQPLPSAQSGQPADDLL